MIRQNGNHFCGHIVPVTVFGALNRPARPGPHPRALPGSNKIYGQSGIWIGLSESHLEDHHATAGSTQTMFTPYGYWLALLSASHLARDAALTMAARAPILAEAAFFPEKALDPEILVMASEKLAAMLEGALGAQQEMAHLAASVLRGESLPHLLRRTRAIGIAAYRPARRRVRANARRLVART
jgi:hypothetical protein